ncbi:MAG: hypothetical protein ACK4M7_05025 [Burkholderiales bacterium]
MSQPQNKELSEAAKILRTSTDPEQRKQAAKVMGKKGGSRSPTKKPVKKLIQPRERSNVTREPESIANDNSDEVLLALHVGRQITFSEAMQELLKLEGSTVEAYKFAVKHINDIEYKEAITLFLEDHQRHIEKLAQIAHKYKVRYIKQVETLAKIFYAKMKVVVGDIYIIGDGNILRALLNNEKDTNSAYERMLNHPAQWPEVADVLHEAFEDEKRHESQLVKMLALI